MSDILLECSREIDALHYFVAMCRRGIRIGSQEQNNLKFCTVTLRVLGEESTPPTESELARAEQMELVAQAEVDLGFPTLLGLSVVNLWSLLETTVEKLTFAQLTDRTVWETNDRLAQLKGPLVAV